MTTYPLHLIDSEHITGLGKIIVRPIWPQDQINLSEFYRRLSQASRTQRFMNSRADVPLTTLEALIDVDYQKHFALLATSSDGAQRKILAEARCVSRTDNPTEWEFAVCVGDKWQKRGLGAAMLRRILYETEVPNVSKFTGEAYATNIPMIRLARRLGFSIEQRSAEVRFTLAASVRS